MAGRPYTAGGIRRTVAATRPRPTSELLARAPHSSPRCAAQGTTTVEIKSGYGLTVADEARSPAARRASSPPRPRSSARTSCPPSTRTTGRVRRPRDRPDARGLRAARAMDRRVLRPRRVRRRRRPRDDPRRRARARASALRMHADQLARPRRPARRRARRGERRPLHLPRATRTWTRWPRGDTVATLLPGVEFSTRQPYPDARRLLDAGVTVALATDCNPAPPSPRRCRSASRSPCARWA